MKQTLWLSYDLGVKGDYEGLFTWLDAHGAKECVGPFAYLTFEYDGDVLTELKKSLKDAVKFDSKSRLYVIYRKPNKIRQGTFLIGGRKSAPWAGFAPSEDEVDGDEE